MSTYQKNLMQADRKLFLINLLGSLPDQLPELIMMNLTDNMLDEAR